MNNELVIRGIVIKNTPYGENDGIINCLTEEGIITFKARGILKPTSKNASSCLLYAYSEFTLESKNNHRYLSKAKLIDTHYRLYDSLDYMCCIGIVSESILTFLDENTSKIIFNSFKKMLEGLNSNFNIFTLTAICLAKVINESGYGLEVNRCIICEEKTKIVSFSFNEGGYICKRCLSKNHNIEKPEYLKSLRYVFNVDIDNYYHYILNDEISKRLIHEFILYLQIQFGYHKLGFYDLFKQTY